MRSLITVELTNGRCFALPATAPEAGGLADGMTLLPGMIASLAALEARTAYRLAFARLGRWESSAAETARYLRQRGFSDESIGHTVDRLRAERALNDERVAESHVSARHWQGGRGRQLVRQELVTRGIDLTTAENATAALDDDAAALSAALARGRRGGWSDGRSFAANVGPFLQRRGFDHATIARALRAAWGQLGGRRDDDDLDVLASAEL